MRSVLGPGLVRIQGGRVTVTRIQVAARAWAERGYYVYPVRLTIGDGKKVPDFPGPWSNSTRDETMIDRLFTDDVTGISVDTGKSGIVVIDIDTSGDKDGFAEMARTGLELPVSEMTATTWSGGQHRFFRQPAAKVGTGANLPVPGVDFRGLGGVIFAAPSEVRYSNELITATYELDGPLTPVDELPILPEWYAARIRSRPVSERPEAERVDPALLRDDQRAKIEWYIEQDTYRIRESGAGTRNQVLTEVVFCMAHRAQQLGWDRDQLMDTVLGAYRASGGQEEQQPEDHVRSAWRKAAAEPWSLPETEIDREASRKYDQMVATQIAKQRLSGDSARLLTESSFVDWTAEPPEAEYWISGVIPKGEQVVLYGRPEAGKTFMALDWSLSVATGRTTFGHGTSRGRVMYMSGEGNSRITARIHAWTDHHGLRPDVDSFLLVNHVPDLMNDRVIENLGREVARREIDVVIVDTLGRAMAIGGGDVSAPPDMAQALKNMQAISRYRPTTTPIVIHHPIKSGDMAGAYNFLGGVDVALKATVEEGSTTGTIEFVKRKDGVKGRVCEYQWKESGRSAVLVPAGTVQSGQDPFKRG